MFCENTKKKKIQRLNELCTITNLTDIIFPFFFHFNAFITFLRVMRIRFILLCSCTMEDHKKKLHKKKFLIESEFGLYRLLDFHFIVKHFQALRFLRRPN